MSECMTIDVFPAEEKYPDEEPTAKDIAEGILTEALHSVVVSADKDSNHIGDCKIGEEFLPELGCFPGSEGARESCEEEKLEKEYRVVKEEALADSELRFENGKIHIQANGAKAAVNLSRESAAKESGQEKPEECWKEGEPTGKGGEGSAECERPFTPFTTEDLRKSILQVWKNVNSPVLNGWDGELVNQPQEVVRLMEDLATIRVSSEHNKQAANSDEQNIAMPTLQQSATCMTVHVAKTALKPGNRSGGAAVTENKGVVKEAENPGLRPLSVPSGSEFAKFNEVREEMFLATLTESDEAFIESSESVIQVIEPRDDSNDENEEENSITFSLMNEHPKDGEMSTVDYQQYNDSEDRREEDAFPRYVSGMTTVGPIKTPHHDPKILTGPEVDYGRMTRISGSRELKKETSEERKTLLEDGEDSPVIFFENGYMEFDTIVNHDIASMTKMQKVKEVLSDQPKSEEDLRGDEKLMRSPLDLKDVDADSCDSYDVIDIGIPLLTVDETNRNSQSKDIGPDDSVNDSSLGEPDEKSQAKDKSPSKSDSTNDETPVTIPSSYNKSVTQVNTVQKHNTIGRVFQKASNRFIMKDSDSFLRNSRSLPRDTSKLTNTESFRSLLDDCQTSAATVLKKSRSLLRTTQTALKAVSRHAVSGDKQMYPEPDITSDSSSTSRRSEFLRLKDTIKNKVGKTLKSFESMKTGSIDRDSVDQKKPSPKSHLVYANQRPATLPEDRHGESFDAKEDGNVAFGCDPGNQPPDKEIEVICGVKFQGNRRFTTAAPPEDSNDTSSDIVDYVVMENIRSGIEPQTAEEEEDHLDGRPKSAAGGATEAGKLADAKKSFVLPADTADALEDYMGSESLTNAKLRRKGKKLSARIRSFWQMAFGRVKATAQKKDLS